MKFLIELLVGIVIVCTVFFVYQKYGDTFTSVFVGEQSDYTVYLDKVALTVTVADSDVELKKGLSGVDYLEELGGKLFIFDSEEAHGIWMKEMLLPIDVMWFDNNLELVHIEENIDPDTYPTVYIPKTPARFILETNAHFVQALQVQLGDRLLLPSTLLPGDIRDILQE